MKSDSIAFAVGGMVFGLIAGWVIGSQHAVVRPVSAPPAVAAAPAGSGAAPAPPALNDTDVRRQIALAEANPTSAAPRIALANLYFDAERYEDAVKWYEAAMTLDPSDPDVSTDLGVSYYYLNQPDRALALFDRSLKIDPRHTKTILNVGIVRAFGKQDLAGATKAWEQVVSLAPASPEGQAARRALDAVKNAHPNVGAAPGTN